MSYNTFLITGGNEDERISFMRLRKSDFYKNVWWRLHWEVA